MLDFKKLFYFKIIACLLCGMLFLQDTTYGLEILRENHLRNPLYFNSATAVSPVRFSEMSESEQPKTVALLEGRNLGLDATRKLVDEIRDYNPIALREFHDTLKAYAKNIGLIEEKSEKEVSFTKTYDKKEISKLLKDIEVSPSYGGIIFLTLFISLAVSGFIDMIYYFLEGSGVNTELKELISIILKGEYPFSISSFKFLYDGLSDDAKTILKSELFWNFVVSILTILSTKKARQSSISEQQNALSPILKKMGWENILENITEKHRLYEGWNPANIDRREIENFKETLDTCTDSTDPKVVKGILERLQNVRWLDMEELLNDVSRSVGDFEKWGKRIYDTDGDKLRFLSQTVGYELAFAMPLQQAIESYNENARGKKNKSELIGKLKALEGCLLPHAINLFLFGLNHPDSDIRIVCADLLEKNCPDSAYSLLLEKSIFDDDRNVRKKCRNALTKMPKIELSSIYAIKTMQLILSELYNTDDSSLVSRKAKKKLKEIIEESHTTISTIRESVAIDNLKTCTLGGLEIFDTSLSFDLLFVHLDELDTDRSWIKDIKDWLDLDLALLVTSKLGETGGKKTEQPALKYILSRKLQLLIETNKTSINNDGLQKALKSLLDGSYKDKMQALRDLSKMKFNILTKPIVFSILDWVSKNDLYEKVRNTTKRITLIIDGVEIEAEEPPEKPIDKKTTIHDYVDALTWEKLNKENEYFDKLEIPAEKRDKLSIEELNRHFTRVLARKYHPDAAPFRKSSKEVKEKATKSFQDFINVRDDTLKLIEENTLKRYTGSGDSPIHKALDDIKDKINNGKIESAIKILEELKSDLKTAQESKNVEILTDKWSKCYPSSLDVDIFITDIPKVLLKIENLLEEINRLKQNNPNLSIHNLNISI